MGNVFQKITKFDPISHAFSPGGSADILKPKTAAAPPAYDPSKNPGTQLYPNPGGGPSQGAPGTLFGPPGGNTNAGYALNPWLAAQQPRGRIGTVGNGLSGPGGSLGTGPPSWSTGGQGMPPSGPSASPGGVWLGRGGSNSQSQALQQQMAIAQAIRGGQVRPT